MQVKEFSTKMLLIFEDRNIAEPSKQWVETVFEQVKNYPDDALNKGFKEIMLIHQDTWNKRFGYNGKPSLTEWLGFFGSRPKTDQELLEEHKSWKATMQNQIAILKCWLNDINFNETFPQYYRYTNEENITIKTLIDTAYKKVSRELTKDEILRLFAKIKSEYLIDKKAFTAKLERAFMLQNPEPFLPENLKIEFKKLN